jgi:hypothetical protein
MSDDHTHGPDDEPVGPFPVQTPAAGIQLDPAFATLDSEPSYEPDTESDWIEGADAHDLPTREPALVALGRFAFPPEPPLDDEGEAARDRRWSTRAIVTACVFLLVFNAVSMTNWSRQQEPGWISDTVARLSEVWNDQLALLGADQPRQGVRDTWERAADQRFVGSVEP